MKKHKDMQEYDGYQIPNIESLTPELKEFFEKKHIEFIKKYGNLRKAKSIQKDKDE